MFENKLIFTPDTLQQMIEITDLNHFVCVCLIVVYGNNCLWENIIYREVGYMLYVLFYLVNKMAIRHCF